MAHSTGSRFGTAAKVERIIPVEYSAVITRTPSTPIKSWASITPVRLMATGSVPKSASGPSSPVVMAPVLVSAATAPKPTTTTTVASSVYTVDRSDRILIHSETITRHWVTFSAVSRA